MWRDNFDVPKIIKTIKERLPKKAEILCLSLTGSRAFGWATENYDYDIHGLFAAKNYWDYVHLGEGGFDINLYEFGHIFGDIEYQHFELFMNISNPFYINPKFNYKGLMKFCTFGAAKNIQGDISRQIQSFEIDRHPRSALHSYRILMVPIHFLRKQKFELNIYKLNKTYHFKQPEKLKIAYTKGVGDWDYQEVKRNLKFLFKKYQKLCQKKEKKLDLEKTKKWFEKVKKTFYRR